MFKSVYDTLACKAYNTEQIKKELRYALLEGDLIPLNTINGQSLSGIYGIKPGNQTIPTFSHPIEIFIDEKSDEGGIFVCDTRAMLKPNPNMPNGYSISNPTDYSLLITRATLTRKYNENPSSFHGLGDLVPIVFCRWLTDLIVKKLGLSPADQVRVTTVTLFFWYSLLRGVEEDIFTEKEKMNIITKLNQITAIPSTLSTEIVDSIPVMNNVQQYVDVIKSVITNTRIEKLNAALIFSMLGNSWFGMNAKEVAAIAIEHPPTFVAIVSAALDSRAFKKSLLGELVFLNDKKDRGVHFKRAIRGLLFEE